MSEPALQLSRRDMHMMCCDLFAAQGRDWWVPQSQDVHPYCQLLMNAGYMERRNVKRVAQLRLTEDGIRVALTSRLLTMGELTQVAGLLMRHSTRGWTPEMIDGTGVERYIAAGLIRRFSQSEVMLTTRGIQAALAAIAAPAETTLPS